MGGGIFALEGQSLEREEIEVTHKQMIVYKGKTKTNIKTKIKTLVRMKRLF